MRARGRIALSVVAITLLSAHVAPSVDDNNRYLKVIPLGDRVRIAYTVFFGEIPGASERARLDANHDGSIDDHEARAFGDRVGGEVARALAVEIDGEPAPIQWTTVDVGLGTPEVAAGAFSVDLVAYPCAARGRHHVTLRDHFHLDHPGETEVRVEDSPDVKIDRARVAGVDDPSHDFRFAGAGGPIEDQGLDLVYTAGPASMVTADATCPTTPHRHGIVLVLVLVLVLVTATLAAALLLVRRRRATAS